MKIKPIVGCALSIMLTLQSCQQEFLKPPKPSESPAKENQQPDRMSQAARVGAAVSPYGSVTIKNAASGLYMEVGGFHGYNNKFKDGTKITQFAAASAGDLWQTWQTIYVKTENGIPYYALRNAHSGKFLDVPNSSSTPGEQLQQWHYNGTDAQLFEFRELEGGYAIINKGNGLAVTNKNSSTTNGTEIVQEVYTGSSPNGVTFFQHCSYGGYAVVLPPGNYSQSQLQALGIANNDVSSLRVPAGYSVTLYNNSDFTGSSLTKTSDDDCLVNDGWNDLMSSVVVSTSGGTNLALNKPVVVSSTESSSHVAAMAVDGNPATRWSSNYSDPQWIYVDLGSTQNIARVKITWETAHARDYEIQVSTDASNWTTIRTVVNNSTLVNDLTGLSGSGRYVRMYGTARGTMWGYSIFEMEVYGGTGSPVTAPPHQTWILTSLPAESYLDDEVTRYFQRNNPALGSVAWDQGSSIPLTWSSNNGKVLWVTQDAWDGAKLQSNNMFRCTDFFDYNNSIIIQQNKNDWAPDDPNMTIDSPMGRPKQICSNQPGTHWSWPSNGVEINNKVYMHCGEGVNLTLTNQSIYELTQSTGTHWTVQRLTPAGMSGQTTINYASGMVKASDGYVYVFGTEGIGFGYYNNVHVARFHTSDPMIWTFWNGSTWTSTPTPGSGARIAEGLATVAVNYVNGKYVLMTMDNGWSCESPRNIYMATSTSPTGPFTTRTMVYKINDFMNGQYTRYYTPNIHPHFDNGRNELLITYSVNQSACGVSDCVDGYIDPNYYRIRAVRVPYSKIGL